MFCHHLGVFVCCLSKVRMNCQFLCHLLAELLAWYLTIKSRYIVSYLVHLVESTEQFSCRMAITWYKHRVVFRLSRVKLTFLQRCIKFNLPIIVRSTEGPMVTMLLVFISGSGSIIRGGVVDTILVAGHMLTSTILKLHWRNVFKYGNFKHLSINNVFIKLKIL